MTGLDERFASRRVAVLVAAAGAAWEPAWLEALARPASRVVLARRCLDLPELLATATTGVAEVAVVSADLPGLDADSVQRLHQTGVRTVALAVADAPGARARLARLGVDRVLEGAATDELRQAVQALAAEGSSNGAAGAAPDGSSSLAPGGDEAGDLGVATGADDQARPDLGSGRVVAVCGPYGSPGRTTVAVGIAAEAARGGRAAGLLDADPYGGSVGLHLALLDEVSGLLAAARLANAGELTPTSLRRLARQVQPGLRVLTGLPRPDRWREVRPQALAQVLACARACDEVVVVDCGPGLPESAADPFDSYAEAPAREDLTTAVLQQADAVVVVGAADPVGLTRLVRALPAILECCPGVPVHVVVNRMRSGLGWTRADVEDLVASVAPRVGLHLLPDDPAAADRALVAGRTLVEDREGHLRRAVAALAREALGAAPGTPRRRRHTLRRR